MLHGIVLRSPHAAAKIGAIDTTAAASVAGVKAIYTAADLRADGIGPLPCAAPVQNRDGSDMANPPHPALADGAVRHVGDPVAFIVADTASGGARRGRSWSRWTTTFCPPSPTWRTSTDAGAPLVWPDVQHNIVFDWEIGDKAATDALFATAAHVTSLTVVNNRIIVASMEARAAIADYDAGRGRWTLYANTQGGWLIKNLLGAVFQTEPANFRVVTPDVGGGFGMKLFLYAEHVLTCYAARKLGRPVKWASDRSEAFLADTQGRDNVTLGELAIDKDGKFLALRTRNVANMGAYLSNFAPYIPTLRRQRRAVRRLRLPADLRQRARRVHQHGAGGCLSRRRPARKQLPARAPGRCRGARTEHRPRGTAPAQHGPAVGDAACHARRQDLRQRRLRDGARCGARRGWTTPASPPDARRQRGAANGAALASPIIWKPPCGDPTERAEIRFADDGFVDVYVGTQSTGQGHETAYIQLTSQRLGIDGEKIRIRQGDTDTIPVGGGTGGSRSLYSEGQAILVTADTVIDKGKQAAAEVLEAAAADIAFADGTFSIVGTDRGDRHPHARRDATAEGRGRRAGDHARCRRNRRRCRTHLPQRLPHGRSGGGSRDRHGRDRPLSRVRRLRQDGEPDDRARPGAWRRIAGPRPGAAGAHRLRRVRPASVRQLHGLCAAARSRSARHRGRSSGSAQRAPIRSA